MLMWYGNLPEEVVWFQAHTGGPWLWVALLLALLHFFVPFFALVAPGRQGGPEAPALGGPGGAGRPLGGPLLAGLPRPRQHPLFSWPELGFALFFIGGTLLWVRGAMERGEDMPVGDPFLREGLEFRL